MSTRDPEDIYIALISIHGLIRGENLELGRDADTGGQVLYVLELARALGKLPNVAQVDLMTRLIVDESVDPIYAQPIEEIAPNVNIVRIEAGPEEYICKEELWDHLDSFADNAAIYLRTQAHLPTVIHSHYADAGYVGAQLSKIIGISQVHTGHSLGRVKRMRLLANGVSHEEIETSYNMMRRIDAEEVTLASAELVIASTNNEVEEQYGLYDCYQPENMTVIPPGTNLDCFYPPDGSEDSAPMSKQILNLFDEPKKPMILAIARSDPRKNLGALVAAYGENKELQELGNLVVIAGPRDDILEMEDGAREVLTNILIQIDKYDLNGKIAFPKTMDDSATMYRIAAASGGVFVNPALTEPFGLTILEAAASGLPVVVTEDGGPTDILGNCDNGILIDPLDTDAIGEAIASILRDKKMWTRMRDNGLKGVKKHYTWDTHADNYLKKITSFARGGSNLPPRRRRRSIYRDRAIFTDIDQSLIGNPEALARLKEVLHENRNCAAFGIVTGRSLDSALRVIRKHHIPMPDILITEVGTEIHYAPKLIADTFWTDHVDHNWSPRTVHRLLSKLPGLKLQSREFQSRFKISYFIDLDNSPCFEDIQALFYQAELNVNLILSFGQFLDVVPARASKGLALRYAAHQLQIPLDHVLVAGGSGADEDMMRGNMLGVVVANRHNEELSNITDAEAIYFATKEYADGILEAIDHYDFYGSCAAPEPASEE